MKAATAGGRHGRRTTTTTSLRWWWWWWWWWCVAVVGFVVVWVDVWMQDTTAASTSRNLFLLSAPSSLSSSVETTMVDDNTNKDNAMARRAFEKYILASDNKNSPWRPLTDQETRFNAEWIQYKKQRIEKLWEEFRNKGLLKHERSSTTATTATTIAKALWNLFEPGFVDSSFAPPPLQNNNTAEDGNNNNNENDNDKCPFWLVDLAAGETGDSLTQLVTSDLLSWLNKGGDGGDSGGDGGWHLHPESGRVERAATIVGQPSQQPDHNNNNNLAHWIANALQEWFNRGYVVRRPKPHEICYWGQTSNPAAVAPRLQRLEQLVMTSAPRPVRYAHFVVSPTSTKDDKKNDDQLLFGPDWISRHVSGRRKSAVLVRMGRSEGRNRQLVQDLAKSGVVCEFQKRGVQIDLYMPPVKVGLLSQEAKNRFLSHSAQLQECGAQVWGDLWFQYPYPANPT